jgi:hypothetical protein
VTLLALSSALTASADTLPSSTHGKIHWTQNRSEFPYGTTTRGAGAGGAAAGVAAVAGVGVVTGGGAVAAVAYDPLAALAAC